VTLILILRPMQGRRLSWPRRLANCHNGFHLSNF